VRTKGLTNEHPRSGKEFPEPQTTGKLQVWTDSTQPLVVLPLISGKRALYKKI
jgi:hypothetical protein